MIISKDFEIIQKYLSDESNAFNAKIEEIEAIYYPEEEEEIKEIVEEANKNSYLLTISGAGTSITGSRVPLLGGRVISTERFLKLKEIKELKKIEFESLAGRCIIYLDEEKKIAILPPGLSLISLSEMIPKDLFYPPDPTENSALIGATVATNASGARSFYYGATRNWIEGIDLILGNGDTLKLNRGEIFADEKDYFDFKSESGERYRFKRPLYHMPTVKNSAGLYTKKNMDLLDLFIGSEGILGVITKIKIKLTEKSNFLGEILFFKEEEDALDFIFKLRGLKEKGIISIEYFDENCLNFIKEKHPLIKRNYKACVFTELFPDEDLILILSEIMGECNVEEDWFAESEKDILKQKEFRHALPEAVNSYLKQNKSSKLGSDLVVPEDKFPLLMNYYKEIGRRFKEEFPREGFHYLLFGHIGDFHLHFNFITQNKEELEVAKEFYKKLALKAVSLKGTISGEHGVGKKMIKIDNNFYPYLKLLYGMEGLHEIGRVKKIFDPKLILNIGNMISKDILEKI